MPRVTLEYKKRMRQVIIDAAIANFTKYGYAKTGMDDIAESTRVSPGTLYLYFPGKEDLFYSVCRHFADILSSKSKVVFDSKKTLRADLGLFYDEDVHMLKNIEKIWIEALSESKQNPRLRKVLRDEQHNYEQAVLEMLHETKKRGVFLQNCTNLQHIAASVVALFDGLATSRMVGRDYEFTKKSFVNTMERIILS